MTPLAAQLFRNGDDADRAMLAKCQFFECTRIRDMAQEMAFADVDAGGSAFSEMAQLPASLCVIEVHTAQGRMMFMCEQHGPEIRYGFYIPRDDGVPIARFVSGFTIGTEENAEIEWASYPGEPRFDSMTEEQRHTARGFNLTLEKLLCIINQPGLVERVPRPTDKRIQRAASSLPDRTDLSKWHECRIRPGQHGKEAEGAGEGREMPLHYVRKYYKPSTGKWVDGYWRGNADIGTYLKWYSVAGSISSGAIA